MQPVIIRADQVEKYYPQPNENRIQVISPTDLSISAGEIVALGWVIVSSSSACLETFAVVAVGRGAWIAGWVVGVM